MSFDVSVTLSGPLLSRAGAEQLAAGIRAGLEAAGKRGTTAVTEQLSAGHGLRSGEFRDSIHDTVTGPRTATVEAQGIIYDTWLESGPHGRQPEGSFHGYQLFEHAASKLDESDLAALFEREIIQRLS